MADIWSLKAITIEGFRGYGQRRTLDLSLPFTLVEGPQGSGKSSTLTAVEWVLFGDAVAKKATGIDERKSWLVRNRHAGEAVVVLVLQKGNDELIIVRSDKKKQAGAIFYYELNKVRYTDEGQLHALLGISVRDYFSSVHLHQEVVRALLTEEPKSRRDMLDRLLGLSDIRNMVDGIKHSKVGEAAKDAQKNFNNFEDQLKAVINSKWADIGKTKSAAASRGLPDSSFSSQGIKHLCADIKTRISHFADGCSLQSPELPNFEDLAEQRIFFASAKQAIRTLRNEQPDLKRQTELLEKQSRYQELLNIYNDESRKLADVQDKRRIIVNQDGEARSYFKTSFGGLM